MPSSEAQRGRKPEARSEAKPSGVDTGVEARSEAKPSGVDTGVEARSEAKPSEVETVGLIAGSGRFPLELTRSAQAEGRRVAVAGLRELADPTLAAEAAAFEWLHLGELGRLCDWLAEMGASEVVMAGKVPKTFLWQRPDAFRPDARALSLLAKLRDRKDDSLLGGVAFALEEAGFRLLPQTQLAPRLVARAGPLGSLKASAEQEADIAFGWPIAKALGGLDVGQSVVIQRRAVLALEAVEGTDAAIARGCALRDERFGVCVVKVAKPNQDPRFDLPAIGADTVRALVAGGGGVLAVEADATIVLDRSELVRAADAAGVAVVGVDRERFAGAGA